MVFALILWKFGLELLICKLRQLLTEFTTNGGVLLFYIHVFTVASVDFIFIDYFLYLSSGISGFTGSSPITSTD